MSSTKNVRSTSSKSDACPDLLKVLKIANCHFMSHLVGAGKQRGWYGQPERLCSLQIDRKLVLGRSLHRQICRLFAFEDAVYVIVSSCGPEDRECRIDLCNGTSIDDCDLPPDAGSRGPNVV